METIVGLYARISEDPDDTRLGVERQREDARAVAATNGWVVHREYVDNDLSAYRRGVVRPDFERMVLDLREGVIDGIVVYDIDRLVRQPRDLERLIDIYEGRNGLVFASCEGSIDLQTSSGLMMARVGVAFANKSSSDTSRRVSRKHLEKARHGEAVGHRAFGWNLDGTLRHSEAGAVRRAVADILSGASCREVAADLNASGFETTQGRPWVHQTLRQYLRNPRLVGWRTRHRKIMRQADGSPVVGQWEPLLEEGEWLEVQELFTGRSATGAAIRRSSRRYALSGVLRCGVCGGSMSGNRKSDSVYSYRCSEGQHTLSISGAGMDALIGRLVVEYFQRADLGGEVAGEWSGEASLRDVGRRIEQTMRAFTSGEISAEIAFPAMQALEAQQVSMAKERSRWIVVNQKGSVDGLTMEEWESATPHAQRRVVESVIESILIRPNSTGRRFDPSRAEVVWRRG